MVQDVDEGRLVGGRYRLTGVLGRGGMGTVWRGRDETLGRLVAVKELRFPSSIEEEEKQRLIMRTLREAKAIARIRSGSAVTVYDVVDEDDRPWIVMELIEGRSLAERIRQEGPLSPQRVAEVGLALLDVLRAAHQEGILHRDVKPSNVLLEEGTGRAVLTDFGIAKVAGDPSITSTGMLVGAPSYISPERARGKPPGPPADLWSLGGLLFAAVEGKPPYDNGSAISTLTAVMTEPVPRPERAGPLSEVILGLLEKDPDKRLDVGGARVLLETAAGGPVSAPPPAPGPPAEPEDARPAGYRVEPEDARPAGYQVEPEDARPADYPPPALSTPPRPHDAMPPIPPPARPPSESVHSVGPRATAEAGLMAGPVPGGPPVVRGNGPGAWPQANPGFGSATSRRTIVIAVVVIVLLVVVGLIVANAMSGGDDDASSEGGSGQTGEQDDTDEQDQADNVEGPDSRPGPHLNDGGEDKDQGKQDAALPDGYQKAVDKRFHFSMAMPQDFQRTGIAGRGSGAKYGSPDGGYPRIQVDYNDSPLANAVLAWKGLEPVVRKSSRDYKPLFLKSVDWRGYPSVADWAFTRTEGDQPVRVFNRGFKVDGERGYAIMVTCKAGEWNDEQCVTLRETALRTFSPL